ncbi:hypothetical protein SSX86_019534 [Deinandra increscens subsp. villosa]|uniref:Sesquiterpene synthase n=1 Tax=Deinandra increscens subsp. villosa TaxID=3103831 RepID=A0AAP0D008_9ASTR
MDVKHDEVIRPLANFHPSVWGDQFLVYNEDQEKQTEAEQMIKILKEEVRKEIVVAFDASAKDHMNLLKLVNAIKRLGVAYYFEKEIDEALQHIYIVYGDKWNGDSPSLWFRLLREHGYSVSCNSFNCYKDDTGSFKESLTNDVQCLLDLYEATYLRVHGEAILDDALDFTKTHLENISKDPLRCNSALRRHIMEALERPIRKRLPRLDAVRYIPFYEQQVSHNKSLLKLAKLGFNVLQSLHKKELSQVTKWWKGLDAPKNLPYMRDRLVECYFWIFSVYFEPQYSRSRIFLSKVILMAMVIDDTYDAYGTYKELDIFTKAFQRWSTTCLDSLPDYMKLIYKRMLGVYEEMEEIMAKEGRAYEVSYAKESMIEYIENHMKEARWREEGYVPTMEEIKLVRFMTCGYKMLATSSFVGMGDVITEEALKWVEANPPIVNAAAAICRFMDDVVGHKEEHEREHVASSLDSYMTQLNTREEEKVVDMIIQHVEDAWKDINRELLICKNIPMRLMMNVLNLARVIDTLYKYKDTFTNVGEEFKDHIRSCFVHTMS